MAEANLILVFWDNNSCHTNRKSSTVIKEFTVGVFGDISLFLTNFIKMPLTWPLELLPKVHFGVKNNGISTIFG